MLLSFWSNLLALSRSHEAQAAGVAPKRWGIVQIKLLDSKYPEAGETKQFFSAMNSLNG